MSRIPTAGDLMTNIVITASLETPLWEARKMLESKSIRHLPVVENGRLVGVLSDRDIKEASFLEKKELDLQVKDVCCFEVYQAAPETALADVCFEMAEKRVGCAVVTEQGEPVGIVTTVDICKAMGKLLEGLS